MTNEHSSAFAQLPVFQPTGLAPGDDPKALYLAIHRSRTTLRHHRWVCQQLYIYLLPNFLQSPQESIAKLYPAIEKFCPKARSNIISAISGYVEFLIDMELIRPYARRLLVRPKLPPRKQPRILGVNEQRNILKCASSLRRGWGWTAASRVAFMLLGLHAGLRLAEAAYLTWSELDIEGREIRLATTMHRRVKSHAGVRRIPMTNTLAFWLEAAFSHRLDERGQPKESPAMRLFTGNGELRKHWRHVHAIPGMKDVSFHALRRTFCSALLAHGIPNERVMQLMGHDDLGVTSHHYCGHGATIVDFEPERFGRV